MGVRECRGVSRAGGARYVTGDRAISRRSSAGKRSHRSSGACRVASSSWSPPLSAQRISGVRSAARYGSLGPRRESRFMPSDSPSAGPKPGSHASSVGCCPVSPSTSSSCWQPRPAFGSGSPHGPMRRPSGTSRSCGSSNARARRLVRDGPGSSRSRSRSAAIVVPWTRSCGRQSQGRDRRGHHARRGRPGPAPVDRLEGAGPRDRSDDHRRLRHPA